MAQDDEQQDQTEPPRSGAFDKVLRRREQPEQPQPATRHRLPGTFTPPEDLSEQVLHPQNHAAFDGGGADGGDSAYDASPFQGLLDNSQEAEATGFFASLTGGANKRSKSANEREEERLAQFIQEAKLAQSIHGKRVFYVPVWSQKGGVGKTTTAVGVAQSIARNRIDSILLSDINPDGGSAAVKVGQTTNRTILDLRDAVTNPEQARQLNPGALGEYFNRHQSRLLSLVLPPGKKASPEEELSAKDFYFISQALEQLMPFKIMFIDCGTNPSSPVMSAVRHLADQMIIITSTKPDEATVASGGIESLRSSGFGYLVDRAITVVVDKEDPKSLERVRVERRTDESRAEVKQRSKSLRDRHLADAQRIWDYFEANTAQVLHVPNDPMISLTSQLNVEDLSPACRLAYTQVAAAVVESLEQQSNARVSGQ